MLWLFSAASGIFAILLIVRWYLKGKNWDGRTSARGKTVIVTGSNSGIGRALAEELQMRGADRVILACRSAQRADDARKEMIQTGAEPDRVSIELVDLMSFGSVINFCDRIKENYPIIDVLVCNAGVLHAEGVTENGHEKLLQANYLGHFLMVESLRSRVNLKRVVFVSSLMHKQCKTEDLTVEVGSGALSTAQYERAKLAEVSYAKHLATQGMESYSCNPGVVHTNILAGTWMVIFETYLSPLLAFIMKNPLEGAQTALMLSLAPADKLIPGAYYSDCRIDATHPLLKDAGKIKRMHEQSVSLVKDFL